jgi:hypothetical protein
MSDVKHTPTPWVLDGVAVRREHDRNYFVADCDEPLGTRGMNEANAAFIVRACNNHNALVAERDALLQRVAELERDAERYRWLRHRDNQEAFYIFERGDSEEELDAAIDAALKSARGEV